MFVLSDLVWKGIYSDDITKFRHWTKPNTVPLTPFKLLIPNKRIISYKQSSKDSDSANPQTHYSDLNHLQY